MYKHILPLILLSSSAFADALSNPTQIEVSNVQSYSASLTFMDNSLEEDGFKVFDRVRNTLLATVPAHTGTGEVTINLDLNVRSRYQAYVIAYKDNGETSLDFPGDFSVSEEFITPDENATLENPTQVEISNIQTHSATLTFMDNSLEEDTFAIYDRISRSLITTLPAHAQTGEVRVELDNLKANTAYQLYVVANNQKGETSLGFPGDFSHSDEFMSAFTSRAFRTSPAENILLNNPTQIEISNIQTNSATLTFMDNALGEDTFNIYDRVQGKLVKTIAAHTGIGEVRVELDKLRSDTSYELYVSANKNTGESSVDFPGDFSVSDEFKTLSKEMTLDNPTDIEISDIQSHSATLTFMDNALEEDNFKVFDRISNKHIKTLPAHAQTGEVEVTLDNLKANTHYELYVSANKDTGESSVEFPGDFSVSDKFVTLFKELKVAKRIGIKSKGKNFIKISFKHFKNVKLTGYKIYDKNTDTLLKTIDAHTLKKQRVYTRIENLEANTKYKLYIEAYSDTLDSVYSKVKGVKTRK